MRPIALRELGHLAFGVFVNIEVDGALQFASMAAAGKSEHSEVLKKHALRGKSLSVRLGENLVLLLRHRNNGSRQRLRSPGHDRLD